MLITFEGAPAVGKSTTATTLETRLGWARVAEANHLFPPEQRSSPNAYLQCQARRWALGRKLLADHDTVIFDGDLFQPLWFNWIYRETDLPDLSTDLPIYKEMLARGHIGFPDAYVLFTTTEAQRRERELNRGRGQGHSKHQILTKYERYRRMVLPQRKYFEALKAAFPQRVFFLNTTSLEESLNLICSLTPPEDPHQDKTMLGFISKWLTSHQPDQWHH